MIFVMLVTCTGLTFAADDSSKSSKPKTKAESKSGEKKKESGKKSVGGMGYGGARRSK